MRVHATPLLVVKASEESPHEPAPKMVPQPTLPRLRPSRRRSGRDPLSEGAPLPMQTLCGRTFTQTKDSAFYRMHKPKWLVVAVMTLLSYGCPLQAIVAAFDLDERYCQMLWIDPRSRGDLLLVFG